MIVIMIFSMKTSDAKNLERTCIESFSRFRQVKESGPLVVGDQQFNDIVQKFITFKSEDDLFNSTIKPVIMRNLYEAEGRSAGSAQIFLHLLDLKFNRKSQNIVEKIDFAKLSNIIERISRQKVLKRELLSVLDGIKDEKIKEIITDIVQNMDRDDQIDVRRTHTDKTRVNKVSGNSFTDIKIDQSYALEKSWIRKNVNLVLVDGVIERSSHVEKLLMISNEKKESFVVVCRDATDEVKGAFVNNFLRKTTDSILITAPYTEKTAHIFNDLKVVTGCEIISPEMGDIVTPQIYKRSQKIEEAMISRDSFIIVNTSQQEKIDSLKRSLIQQLNETYEDQVKDLLRRRIKTLSGSTISIHIGDDFIMRDRTCIEKIDKSFRLIKDILGNGIIVTTSLDLLPEIALLGLADVLPISTLSFKIAIDQFVSFNEILASIGYIVLED